MVVSTPLMLSYPGHPSNNDKEGASHGQEPLQQTILRVLGEMKELNLIAFPLIITGLLMYGKSALSLFFMGKLGKEALAGGSLAIGIANITGYSVISGLTMGMDAISCQAFGAKRWPLLDQTLQRTIAILISACIPISILWFNVRPLLIFTGQNATISSVASTYLAFSLPDLAFQALINPIRVYLRAQNITLPLMLTAALSLAVHAPVNYFLVHCLGLGIEGIAMAAMITDLVLLCALLAYLFFSGIFKRSSQVFSIECCFVDWKPILTLAVPSCISVCLEWWWYELMIVLCGLLTNATEAVSTMGILLQATSFVYIFPSSLSQAVSTRVGNELGANQPHKAKASSRVALSCATLTSFLALLFMTKWGSAWGRAFTTDETILSLTSMAMPVVGLCELGNCPQTTVCGVLRGSARPSLGANINVVSFYGIGLPLGIAMAFYMDMGLVGLWIGLMGAQIVCAIFMGIVLFRTDWVVQAKRAGELI